MFSFLIHNAIQIHCFFQLILTLIQFRQFNGNVISANGNAACIQDEDCTINCDGFQQCKSATLTCPTDGYLCTINCSGDEACEYANIHWPLTPGLGTLNCLGSGQQTCKTTVFPVPDPNTALVIYCTELAMCEASTIYCPSNADCRLECDAMDACQLANIIWPTNSSVLSTITCGGEDACKQIVFPMPNSNIPLTITCDSDQECDASTIYCPSDANCVVQCGGAAIETCRLTTIYCPTNANCDITCSSSAADNYVCKSMTVYAPTNYPLTLTCSSDDACFLATVHAENASFFTLNDCNIGGSVCVGMTIYLPQNVNGIPVAVFDGADTSLRGDSSTGDFFHIYAINGFRDLTVINYEGNYGDNDAIFMHCLIGYSQQCALSTNTGKFECDPNGPTICNNPPTNSPTVAPTTAVPTNVPTTYTPTTKQPSVHPTTSNPTTPNPTTSNPTTSNPTSNPTTSLPTTSIPTSNPTTSVPTTSIPTTSIPTTSIPTTNPTSMPTTSIPTEAIKQVDEQISSTSITIGNTALNSLKEDGLLKNPMVFYIICGVIAILCIILLVCVFLIHMRKMERKKRLGTVNSVEVCDTSPIDTYDTGIKMTKIASVTISMDNTAGEHINTAFGDNMNTENDGTDDDINEDMYNPNPEDLYLTKQAPMQDDGPSLCENIVTTKGQDMDDTEYEWIKSTLQKLDKLEWKRYLDNFQQYKMKDNYVHLLTDDQVEPLIPEAWMRSQFIMLLKEKKNDNILYNIVVAEGFSTKGMLT